MRCIIVSDGNLKADTRCTYCHHRIDGSYAREIGSRFVYCGYGCYERAAETAPAVSRNVPAHIWTVNS